MAFNNLSKVRRLLLLNKLPKFLTSHIHLSKSFKPFLKNEKSIYFHKNYPVVKPFVPMTYKGALEAYSSNCRNIIIQPQTSHFASCESDSPGRHLFHKETEDSLNKQIGAELTAAFSYLSIACYFGRTEIALPGCQGFFMNMYEEELGHAMVFINYLLLRGAYVALCNVEMPKNQDWGSVKKAFGAAIDLEKSVKEKLSAAFDIAEKHKDLQVMDIISTQFMEEQNRSICELARLLKKADMTTDPVGEHLFDKMLYNSFVKKSKDNLMYKNKLDEESGGRVYK